MKKILILGLGVSGISAYHFFLNKKEYEITVSDSKTPSNTSLLESFEKNNISCFFEDSFPLHSLNEYSFIVKSPGIPFSNYILKSALELNISIYTDIEFSNEINSDIVAITGSNGKTTTTALLGDIFSFSKYSYATCGNIGIPILEFSKEDNKKDVLVCELSSFQLKSIDTFKPSISALLNFNPTHLDFHGEEKDYLDSKLKIFKNLTENDFSVLNFDDPNSCNDYVLSKIKSPIFFFSKNKELSNGVFVENNQIIFSKDNIKETICDINIISLKGKHNLENVLAAVLISKLYNLPNKAIIGGIKNFKAVEHRLELLKTDLKFEIYNDSKSTNPTSTLNACRSFDKKIHLFLGGLNRNADFSVLKEEYRNISNVYLFGSSKENIKAQVILNNFDNILSYESLEDAVSHAFSNISEDEILLFSPGCASWDQYNSYIDRGNHFKSIVNSLV